jgi:parallel beta-helix repeat protein
VTGSPSEGNSNNIALQVVSLPEGADIVDCTISNFSEFSENSTGVRISQSKLVNIKNCTITENAIGIDIPDADTCDIVENIISADKTRNFEAGIKVGGDSCTNQSSQNVILKKMKSQVIKMEFCYKILKKQM